MNATASLAATVGDWIGTNTSRLMPTDPTYESGTGSRSRESEKRTTMNGKTTANYSAAEAAIRDLFRAPRRDRGMGDSESRTSEPPLRFHYAGTVACQREQPRQERP